MLMVVEKDLTNFVTPGIATGATRPDIFQSSFPGTSISFEVSAISQVTSYPCKKGHGNQRGDFAAHGDHGCWKWQGHRVRGIALTKSAADLATVAGAKTYNGGTTVSSGSLAVRGNISGSAALAVNNSGTLLLGASSNVNTSKPVCLGLARVPPAAGR